MAELSAVKISLNYTIPVQRQHQSTVSGAENGAERAEIGWSGAERSGARSGRSRSRNGAGSGGYRNRLERGAAFSPRTLRSHIG